MSAVIPVVERRSRARRLALPVPQRLRAWWYARAPRTDTLLLTQRNLYILPTRTGLMFGFTLLVLLVASINYQLNLGYVLTFLLAGSGLVSMQLTHNTLRGLTLRLRPVAPVFAGEPAQLEVVLSGGRRARFGIGLKIGTAPDATLVWTDVPALGQATVHLRFVQAARGLHELPLLSVQTRFPLGMFRVWSVWRPGSTLMVWPRCEEPSAPLPPARPSPVGGVPAPTRGAGTPEGVRPYRRGDPLKLIAWKKTAQALASGSELVARDNQASVHHELWLDWAQCGALPPEARLSRLAAWVLAAQAAGLTWGVRLPGRELPPDSGDAQRHASLEALALWRG